MLTYLHAFLCWNTLYTHNVPLTNIFAVYLSTINLTTNSITTAMQNTSWQHLVQYGHFGFWIYQNVHEKVWWHVSGILLLSDQMVIGFHIIVWYDMPACLKCQGLLFPAKLLLTVQLVPSQEYQWHPLHHVVQHHTPVIDRKWLSINVLKTFKSQSNIPLIPRGYNIFARILTMLKLWILLGAETDSGMCVRKAVQKYQLLINMASAHPIQIFHLMP